MAFLGVITLSYLRLLAHPNRRNAFFTGLLIGLSLGVLPQLGILIPFVLWGLFYKIGSKTDFARLVFTSGFAILLGLLPFLYLPIRAAAKPAMNWGSPDTWANFWWVVTAAQYHHLAGVPSLDIGAQRLLEGADLLLRQLLHLGIFPAFVGIRWTWHKNKPLCIYLFALVLLSFILKIYYYVLNNDVYLLPAIYAMCLCLGVGLSRLQETIRRPSYRYALVACTVILCSGSIVQFFPEVNRGNDFTAVQFAQEALALLPENAVIFSQEDETTFALWYEQILGIRKDIIVIDTRLLFYSWYQRQLEERYPTADARYLRPGGVTGLQNALYQVQGDFPDFVLQRLK
jgi:hypothetical protein